MLPWVFEEYQQRDEVQITEAWLTVHEAASWAA